MSCRPLFLCLFTSLSFGVEGSVAVEGDPRALLTFLDQHCLECHDPDTEKGGLDLTSLPLDQMDAAGLATWERVFDRIAAHEMPPEKRERPPAADAEAFLAGLAERLVSADQAHKGAVLRRLNRREFENTLNDLFGTHSQIADLLPEDGRSHEFDNVGESLGMSMVQLQRTMEAVDVVLDEAIAMDVVPPESQVVRASYAEEEGYQKFVGDRFKKLGDGSIVFFEASGYPSGTLKSSGVRKAGRYRIRIHGHAHQSEQPITFEVNTDTFMRGAPRPNLGYFSFAPGPEQTVELEVWLPERYMIQIRPWGIADPDFLLKQRKADGYPGPGLAIREVEIEGPLLSEFPSRGHRLLFDGVNRVLDPKTEGKRDKRFLIEETDPVTAVQPVIRRVASAAFRREVEDGEVTDFVELFRQWTEEGTDFETALRSVVKAIFCAPEFVFLRESPGELDSHAVAARLSYFFNRSTPDAELLGLAAVGELNGNAGEVRRQAERLMAKPEFERFIVDFTDAWLNLREIDFTAPDRNLFPEFDPFLQESMLAETRRFFRRLIEENRPVRDLLRPDFAMLNNRLALHYGIEGVEGPELRPVAMGDEDVRGGVLGQGSVLKVSANGTNTSPVMRGVWVMERLLGKIPPPPPPGVPGVEPDIRGATTLRELLVQHRDTASCRSCHESIDPPGFALESFNPIGGWRDRYRSMGEGEKVDLRVGRTRVRYRLGLEVDASGELKGAGAFSGFREFRDLLVENDHQVAHALVEKLLTFASGRELGFSDRAEVKRLVTQARADGYPLRDLMLSVVASPIFLNK